ncbi:hypothetical protein PR048_013650 [Dryococelus australis]|uniref:Uncharacterized protein n=1 Tax=Dryococelus australis TaxID=614101 RepID=A0ABQ9HT31_9NEOP|nr:hypothetical protein PR048_013650 [Dryococelus australis]
MSRRMASWLYGYVMHFRGYGGEVARLRASHMCEPGSIPGFSHVRIVPDEAAGRRVISGISRFPRPFSFLPYAIQTSLHPHRLSGPRSFSLLACHRGDPGLFPIWVTPDFRMR